MKLQKLFLFIIVAAFFGCSTVPCKKTTITKVGGCDVVGFCAVRFENGEFGYKNFPVEGQEVCR